MILSYAICITRDVICQAEFLIGVQNVKAERRAVFLRVLLQPLVRHLFALMRFHYLLCTDTTRRRLSRMPLYKKIHSVLDANLVLLEKSYPTSLAAVLYFLEGNSGKGYLREQLCLQVPQRQLNEMHREPLRRDRQTY